MGSIYGEVVSYKEGGRYTRCPPQDFAEMGERGRIRVVKTVGGIRRIPESELRRLLGEEIKKSMKLEK